jgi:hypothetical protein
MNGRRVILDGIKTDESIMVGDPSLALADQPAVVWWREVENTDTAKVMFQSLGGEAKILDEGVVGDTCLTANEEGQLLAAWNKAGKRGAPRIRLCDPTVVKPKCLIVSEEGGWSPSVALDQEGNGIVVWARVKDRNRIIECSFGPSWKEAQTIYGHGWASRPDVCAVGERSYFVVWDVLSPRGGSVVGCLIEENGATRRELTIFASEKPGLRYIKASCVYNQGKILVSAVRTEDVISPYDVIDQHHEIAVSSVDLGSLNVSPIERPAVLDHALLSDQDQRTNLWGYLGHRLNPRMLSCGRLYYERKEHHDGFTVTNDALGVLCFRDFDLRTQRWGGERILHHGSYLYEVEMTDDQQSWVLHRKVVHDKTHQLVLEFVPHEEERPSQYQWLEAKGYMPVELPLIKEREHEKASVGDERMQLYWGDTHVHSSLSIDPEGEPDELLHIARDLARLDFVAITDNDYLYTAWLRLWDRIQSSELGETWSENGRFVALEGFEYTRPSLGDTPRNHRTVLLRKRGPEIFRWADPVREADRGLVKGHDHRDVDGLKAAAERLNALLICHHGNWSLSDSETETGIEAASSWDTYIHNAERVHNAWNSGRRLCLVGGSDDHRRHAGFGGAATGVWARELTLEGIIAGIEARRTIATQGRRPLIDFRLVDSEDNELFIGDCGKLRGTITVRIEVKVERGFDDRIELVELIHRQNTLVNWSLSDTSRAGRELSVEHRLQGYDSEADNQVLRMVDPKYLYLRIRFSGSDLQFPSNVAPARGPWAWTTPIWWQ